ncbi:glycerate kinase [Diaminobutyricibacter sp. McL0618]|uniref:glycerate kinase n=1 Tax=Leifsonia sp. McL0618 TaxID=3415677 RepID=UPI003CEFA029
MTNRPLRVVVAPDSFKGSATASAVAHAIADGWRSVRPGDDILSLPMADGGEGTVDAFADVDGAIVVTTTVEGPDGLLVDARWVRLPASADAPDGTAVVEIAGTSGLGLLDPLLPLDAHTRGLGQAIGAALDSGVSRILVGLGGSASTDGGAGALQALGARLLSDDGTDVPGGGRGLGALATVDLSLLRRLPPRGVVVLTDVRNPLLGARGAAGVFAPQKGATAADVVVIEANLRRFRDCAAADDATASALSEEPGAGAAGGTGFGLMLWGASVRSGATEIAERVGLPAALADADIVITGEGRFDAQTSEGKVASHVVGLARAAGVPVLLVAGSIAAHPGMFADHAELAGLAGSATESFEHPEQWASRAGAELAARLR